MTTVTFHLQEGRLAGFEVKGHTGLAQEGQDILCAAITSTVRFVECAINDVLGLGAAIKIREKDASISLNLPGGLDKAAEHTCQTILSAMMVYFVQLHEEYPNYIIVMEV